MWVKVMTRVLKSMPASQAFFPSCKRLCPNTPHPHLSLCRPTAKVPTSVSPMAASLHLHSWERDLEVSVFGVQPFPDTHVGSLGCGQCTQ